MEQAPNEHFRQEFVDKENEEEENARLSNVKASKTSASERVFGQFALSKSDVCEKKRPREYSEFFEESSCKKRTIDTSSSKDFASCNQIVNNFDFSGNTGTIHVHLRGDSKSQQNTK